MPNATEAAPAANSSATAAAAACQAAARRGVTPPVSFSANSSRRIRSAPTYARMIGLGTAGFRRLRAGSGEHRDQDHVGLAQHPDGLDRDQFRVAGPDPHADQALGLSRFMERAP